METESSPHWTTDPDLLESYAMGRCSPDQRVMLELHLQECPQCNARVEKEQKLIAGIRMHGRTQMKKRLQKRLQSTSSDRLEVRQVISIAAAIGIIMTGLAIFVFWSQHNRINERMFPREIALRGDSSNVNQSFWIVGRIITSGQTTIDPDRSGEIAKVIAKQQKLFTLMRGTSSIGIRLRQLPVAELENNQKMFRLQEIISRWEKSEEGFTITLYREPSTERDLLESSLQPVTPDSLLITVGGTVIAYRLPSF